jgi:hypothetical protein
MKRSLVAGAAVIAVAGVGVVLWAFQPWKLWVDDTVEQAAPTGARQLVLTPAPATTDAPTTTPTSTTVVPPTTAAPTAEPAPPTTLPAPPTAPAAPETPPPPPPPAAPAGTQFVGIDHSTSGTLLLLQDDAGRRFVRLEDLDTSNGPDLFVYLSANPFDGDEGAFDHDYLNLGRLQGNIGSQNYELPADVDLARYASVVIWCDRFNSAFGAAPLTS